MTNWQPTVAQRTFVDGLLKGMTIKDAAEAAGVTRYAYFKRWSKDSKFLAFLERRRREEAGAKLPKVDQKLFEKAAEGDTAAMRLVYEVFGNLRTPPVEVNVPYRPPQGEDAGLKIASLLDAMEKKVKLRAID